MIKKNRHFLSVVAALLCYVTPVQAEWIGNAGIQYEFNSNLSNARLPSDIKSDSAFRPNLSGGKYFQLTDATGLALTADIGGTTYLHFDGLNNVLYGASTTLRHKFGLGGLAPWISLSGSAAYHDFENAPRDGWRYNLSFAMGKRLTERFTLQLKYRYEEQISDRIYNIPGLTHATFDDEDPPIPIGGDAFNISAHNVSLTGIFTVTDAVTAFLAYTRREGGITSTIGYDPEILEYGDAVAVDRAFGNNRYAYKVEAGTNLISVGFSWAINGHASLNLGYDWMETTGDHHLEYNNNLAHFSLIYSFE
ncbi:MAG: hypothetical protein HOP36_06855 [Methyloglobulus sp.]|nr:hypothetical protein [Methyloglobulus sp.]